MLYPNLMAHLPVNFMIRGDFSTRNPDTVQMIVVWKVFLMCSKGAGSKLRRLISLGKTCVYIYNIHTHSMCIVLTTDHNLTLGICSVGTRNLKWVWINGGPHRYRTRGPTYQIIKQNKNTNLKKWKHQADKKNTFWTVSHTNHHVRRDVAVSSIPTVNGELPE